MERRGRPGGPRWRKGAASPDWVRGPGGASRPSAHAGSCSRTEESRSPDLGAVLQAIRLHFVTDFWTLPPTLPPSGASSRNSPPPQDTNPFQTSDRRQEKSYIIPFGQTAKKKTGGRYVVIFPCVLRWSKERGARDLAFGGRISSRFPPGFLCEELRLPRGQSLGHRRTSRCFWVFP